jgi:ABC-type lipoprotein release transport system permease subunit
MAVPFKYNWRSLRVRRVSTAMTIAGIALAVTVFLLVMPLAEGIRKTFSSVVSERDLVVMRVGAEADIMSFVSRSEQETLRTLPGIARGADNRPLVSPELAVLIHTTRRDGRRADVLVRGVEPVALSLSLLGGGVGAAVSLGAVRRVLTQPVGTQTFAAFTEILFNFHLTPPLLALGIVFSLAKGLLGGIPPAARAARLEITGALCAA